MSKECHCGIVGLPNVGKSTLFNFLTESSIAKSGNFPFCTIEPNKAVVPYKDEDLEILKEKFKSKKKVYSNIEIIDIAGLIAGASQGEGLGNKFLSHIREVNAIIHVVRCFDDKLITHLTNVDPITDLEIILAELRIADLETVEKMIKKAKVDAVLLKELKEIEHKLQTEQSIAGCNLPLLSAKPFLVLGNGEKTEYVTAMSEYCNKNSIIFLNFDFNKGNKQNINLLLKELFKLLDLSFFFTVGPEEARSWLVPKNVNAKTAAAEIHTDISDKFIKAEVFNISEINSKYRVRQEGKEYILKPGDIINFKHNAR